jgi:hypothetical protein
MSSIGVCAIRIYNFLKFLFFICHSYKVHVIMVHKDTEAKPLTAYLLQLRCRIVNSDTLANIRQIHIYIFLSQVMGYFSSSSVRENQVLSVA